jgi:hypothetical protein
MTGVDGPSGFVAGDQHDSGASDIIAFVLMFAIIILGVGIVSLGAFGDLAEFSDREQVESGERGLAAAASTLDSLHRQDDTRRKFNIAPGEGTVFLNSSTINVNVTDSKYERLNMTVQTNSLEHLFRRSPNDVTLAYESGAVFRSPGVRARYPPSLECVPDETAIVSLVNLTGANFNIGGGESSPPPLNPRGLPGESPVADLGQTLIFSAELQNRQREVATFSDDESIRLNVSASANPQQWESYLDDQGWDEVDDFLWECKDVDRALVRVTTIELSL